MFNNKTKFFFIIFVILFVLSGSLVLAAGTEDKPKDPGTTVELPNPLGDNPEDAKPQVLIGKIIKAVLGVVGSIALVMFIYGGFMWMTAAGNQERVTKGKEILIWATIGLIVIFTSYALVSFIFTGIGAVTPDEAG
jgi:hypothetical protein